MLSMEQVGDPLPSFDSVHLGSEFISDCCRNVFNTLFILYIIVVSNFKYSNTEIMVFGSTFFNKLACPHAGIGPAYTEQDNDECVV